VTPLKHIGLNAAPLRRTAPPAGEIAATPRQPTTGRKAAPSPKGLRDRLGRPLVDLRVSVIDACNYRCGYCMPADQEYQFFQPAERLNFDELVRLAGIFGEAGALNIRITGGEPLLRKNLPRLIQRLAALPSTADLALTTNGELLAEHAADLKAAGLKRVTVSLDSLHPERFRELSGGRGDLSRVLKGIEAALAAGLRPLKINTVIQKGRNDRDWPELLAFAREHDLAVRFIEYMDAGNRNGWRPEEVVTSTRLLEEILQHLRATGGPALSAEPHAEFGETARRYRFADGRGAIGFISSVSSPFCGGCTRARLSADGRLYTCLFSGIGVDLRAALRSGADDREVAEIIAKTWGGRSDRYSEERFLSRAKTSDEKVEMFRIGG
jgi:cyclic pyranopterin phosphate synthase